MEYLAVLLVSILLSLFIVSITALLFVIAADKDNENDSNIYKILVFCISFIISTIIIYNIIDDNNTLQGYANKYGCIYCIRYDNKKIYTTSMIMSEENIIIDDVNGDHYEINKDKQSYTITFCKSNKKE